MRTSLSSICLVLLLVDVAQADSLNVRLIGSCGTPDMAIGVAVSGNYAYVADEDSGLRVFSVADPSHPVEVGHCVTPGRAWRVTVDGEYAHVADDTGGLRIISVADPAYPTEVGYYDTLGCARDVAVMGDHAYVADYPDGLRVISVADPTHPVEVGYCETPGDARGVAVDGDYAYVADFDYPHPGLRVISVVDPAHPVSVGNADSLGFPADVAVNGTYAYVAAYMGLHVISVADPTNLLSQLFVQSRVLDGHAYLLTHDGQHLCHLGAQRLHCSRLGAAKAHDAQQALPGIQGHADPHDGAVRRSAAAIGAWAIHDRAAFVDWGLLQHFLAHTACPHSSLAALRTRPLNGLAGGWRR